MSRNESIATGVKDQLVSEEAPGAQKSVGELSGWSTPLPTPPPIWSLSRL